MRDEGDRLLLERARAGDAQAIEALLERHQAQVYRFGLKMCRDPEDAKDVLQDTLLSMARGVRGFRGASSISTWLYTIARSFCIKKRRRSKLAPGEDRSLDTEMFAEGRQLTDPAQSPDEALAGKHVERAPEQAIGSLEPMYREVLLLRDVEGLTAPEVAEVLGVTVQAVKSRLHRARLSVRAQVAPLLGIPTERAAATGTCPDVLTLFSQPSKTRSARMSAPRWSGTFGPATAAAAPVTRSSERSRFAVRPRRRFKCRPRFRRRSRSPCETSSQRTPEPFGRLSPLHRPPLRRGWRGAQLLELSRVAVCRPPSRRADRRRRAHGGRA